MVDELIMKLPKKKPKEILQNRSNGMGTYNIRLYYMVYPLPSLKAQIIAMYWHSGFEFLLEKWANRNSEMDLYTKKKYGKPFHLV